MKSKRIIAVLLCALTVIGLMPTAALAAESTVTIESQTNSAFDYLEYYKDGSWHDLNTPRHVIEQTGEICYCIEHSEGNPHGDTYTAASPSSVFSTNTLAGVQAIMMYGYPCNTPSGFTADEARQATANALRFWLSENGESGSYSFTNRKANPTHIRAKAGYEHVLEWADTLLSYARATGFILSDEVVDVSITTDNKNTAVIDRTNVGNEMVLKKTDLTNGKAVAGATIAIYDEAGDVFFEGKTDENGEIVLKEVPAGKYTYKETIAPSGFALNTETFSFEMDVYGKVTGKTEITNEPIAFMLNKVNTFTNKPFANIEFTLKDAEGNVVKTKMTEDGYRVAAEDGSETFAVDENGYAEFRYLPAGVYKLVENTPIGYISDDEFSITLQVHIFHHPFCELPQGLEPRVF